MIINEPLDRKSDSRAGKNESESSICSKTEYDILWMLFFVLFYVFFIKNRPHAAIKESNNSSRGMFFFF